MRTFVNSDYYPNCNLKVSNEGIGFPTLSALQEVCLSVSSLCCLSNFKYLRQQPKTSSQQGGTEAVIIKITSQHRWYESWPPCEHGNQSLWLALRIFFSITREQKQCIIFLSISFFLLFSLNVLSELFKCICFTKTSSFLFCSSSSLYIIWVAVTSEMEGSYESEDINWKARWRWQAINWKRNI